MLLCYAVFLLFFIFVKVFTIYGTCVRVQRYYVRYNIWGQIFKFCVSWKFSSCYFSPYSLRISRIDWLSISSINLIKLLNLYRKLFLLSQKIIYGANISKANFINQVNKILLLITTNFVYGSKDSEHWAVQFSLISSLFFFFHFNKLS